MRYPGHVRVALAAAAISTTVMAVPAMAQDDGLTLWSHVVHQQVVEGARGGAEVDLGAEFGAATGTDLNWVTIAFDQMDDKIKRELNLSSSEADIVFVVNGWADPSTLRRLVRARRLHGGESRSPRWTTSRRR